jgi:hypothetical protein
MPLPPVFFYSLQNQNHPACLIIDEIGSLFCLDNSRKGDDKQERKNKYKDFSHLFSSLAG